MAYVHMLIGIPGSGKSTFAKSLIKTKPYKIVSSDVIRMMHPEWEETMIFPEVYRLSAEYLKDGQDIIFDATNITPKVRKRFVDNVNQYFKEYQMIAYYFIVDPKICEQRVTIRNENPNELKLPIEVISSYGERLIPPTLEEGFEKIIEITIEDEKQFYQ